MEHLLQYLPHELIVLIVSMLPVIELRGAIPLGVSLGLSPYLATSLGILGAFVPAPIIILSIRFVFRTLERIRPFAVLIEKIIHGSVSKQEKVKKYGFWGLILIVAIPLPGTGVWTGSLAATLMDLRLKKALPAIFIGNLIAGLLLFILSYSAVAVFSG